MMFVIVLFFFPLVSIKELEDEKLSLQSDTENYSDQVADHDYALVWCRWSTFSFSLEFICHIRVLRSNDYIRSSTS